MKKLSLALVLMFGIVCGAAAAEAKLRIEITGFSDPSRMVKVTPVKANGAEAVFQPDWWGKERQAFAAASIVPVKAEWKTYYFAFEAANDGVVHLAISGDWEKNEADYAWVQVTRFTVNDELLPNGDLKKAATVDGKQLPEGIRCVKNVEYAPTGGPEDSGIAAVNFANRLAGIKIPVTAEQVYLIGITAKARP